MELLQTELKNLQETYDNLQEYVTELELKQSEAFSSAVENKSCTDNSCLNYNHSLCKYVADLFQNPFQSDVTILMEEGQVINGHKLILLFRSSEWNGIDLNSTDCLDFSDMKYELVYSMFKWVYTDELDITDQDNLIEMIQLASKFHLKALFTRCEEALKSFVTASNYEDLCRIARKVSANELKDICLKMKEKISQQNSEFSSEINQKCLDCDQRLLNAEELAEHFKNHSTLKIQNLVQNGNVKTEEETCQDSKIEITNFELSNAETEKLVEVKEVSGRNQTLRTNKSQKAKTSKTSLKRIAKSKKKEGKKTCEKKVEIAQKETNSCEKKVEIVQKETNSCEKEVEIVKKETNSCEKEVEIVQEKTNSCKEKVEIVQEFKCPVCVKTFKTSRKLSNHKRTHKRDKIYKCDICSKHFYSSGHHKQHVKVHSELRPFQCDICGATFRQSGGLYSHRSIHTGDKPYKCDECGKTFRMKNCLQIHKRVHSGIKPFICHVCGKGFKSSSHFRRHKVIHTGEKRHQCDVCQKCFQYTHHLKRHLKTHNKIQSQSKLIKLNNDKDMGIQYPVPSHKPSQNLEFFQVFHINETLRDTVQFIHIDGEETVTE